MPCILQHSSFKGEILDHERSPAKDVADVVRHKSFSYYRLPHELLKLSVVKLDGSRFDVQVAKTASVAELKRRVEDVFDRAPEEGRQNISWSHVWGYFCLCYEDFKLINDKELLRNFGINDGAQLRFIRHLSIHYLPANRPKNHTAAHAHCMSLRQPKPEDVDEHGDESDDEDKHKQMINQRESKLAHFLRGWLQCSRLCFMGRSESFQKLSTHDYSSDEEPRRTLTRSHSCC
ncbi:unnamed protein product [Victoria cruziana]